MPYSHSVHSFIYSSFHSTSNPSTITSLIDSFTQRSFHHLFTRVVHSSIHLFFYQFHHATKFSSSRSFTPPGDICPLSRSSIRSFTHHLSDPLTHQSIHSHYRSAICRIKGLFLFSFGYFHYGSPKLCIINVAQIRHWMHWFIWS